MKIKLTAYILLALISIVWGSTFWIIKDVLGSVHAATLISYRFFLAAAVLLPWVWGNRGQFKQTLLPALGLGGILWIAYSTQIWGLYFTTASNSGFITGLFLIFVPILLVLFRREFPSKSQAVAIAISAVGLWFLTGGITGINRGDGLTLITAVAVAAQILLVDRYAKDNLNPIMLNFTIFLVVGILSLGQAWVVNAPLRVAIADWDVIFYLAIFGTAVAFLGQLWAQKVVSPIKSTLIFMLEPLSSAAFAIGLGDEKLTSRMIIGGGCIILGILFTKIFQTIHLDEAKIQKREGAADTLSKPLPEES